MDNKNKNEMKFSFPGKTHFLGIVIIGVIVLGFLVDTLNAGSDNFYSDIIRLDNVATRIHQNYVKEVSSEDLVDNAVEGMLEILDPHTTFFKEKEYEELRIHTEGKFGGLGIQISIRDKVLTVMTPISGTPASRAGIQSGDQIIKIEGESTKGITIDAAVAKLRGEPGSEVSITILRKGESEPLEYVITREVITIKSVPFWGIINNNIGYIRLLSFSQESGEDVERAIKKLIDQDICGIILDLRHNPGGLLPQAIEVAEKFLYKKSLIVSTRGRVRTQNKDFHASSNPVLPKDMSLVVIVNAASASASEIVAGAIQDWDRGVVLGDTTFGKGSVQSILPLDKDHHLKLTTAFYYTPSGRCINKVENGINDSDKVDSEESPEGFNWDKIEDIEKNKKKDEINKEIKTDSSAQKDTVEFRTKGGRLVFGGGGIIPDTIVKLTMIEPVVRALFLKDAFFKFANVEYPKLQKRNFVIDSTFTVDDKLMKEFYVFLDSVDFKFNSYTKSKFDEFRKSAGLIVDTTEDSSIMEMKEPKWTDIELSELKGISLQIENLINKEMERELASCEDEIKKYIRRAFLVRGLGQDNPIVYRTGLDDDKQILAAVGLLTDKESYHSLLKADDGNKQNE